MAPAARASFSIGGPRKACMIRSGHQVQGLEHLTVMIPDICMHRWLAREASAKVVHPGAPMLSGTTYRHTAG